MEVRKILLYLASFVGMLDSFYLIDVHYTANGACSTNVEEFFGYTVDCGFLDSTKYAEILSIPIAIIGLLYYVTIFLVLYFDTTIDKILKKKSFTELISSHLDLVLIFSSMGFLFTLYLLYVQLVIFEIVCIYCIYSAASTFVIFGISISYKITTT